MCAHPFSLESGLGPGWVPSCCLCEARLVVGPFPTLSSPNVEVSWVPETELGVSQAWSHQSFHGCRRRLLISPFHG